MTDVFTIEDTNIEQPTTYSVSFATTSTDDSDRTQDLVMHNTPIGTIGSYEMRWEYIKTSEASKILQLVLNKSQFKVHYYDLFTDSWKSAYFYASNFEMTPLTLEENYKYIDSLSFSIIGVNPI